MSDDVRADARRLLQGITRGPWKWYGDDHRVLEGVGGEPDVYEYDTEVMDVDHNGGCGCRSSCNLEVTISDADAEFIAACPQLVERLVQRIDDMDAAMVEMHEKANTYTTDIEAERDAALAVIAQVRDQLPIWLDEAWDDGNGTGLDGWVGPGRGAGETDDEAVRARRRSTERIAARTILNIVGGEK